MTLPALIANNRNKELENGLKKAYSVMGQALDMYQAENGERITPQNTGYHSLKPILIKYLQVIKDCGWGGGGGASTSSNPNYCSQSNNAVYTTFTNGQLRLTNFDDGQFILNDGSMVMLENGSSQLFISVDVNGVNKKPNRLGHDLFMFQIDNKGSLLPMGVPGTSYYSETDAYCSPSIISNMNGAGCTYKALNDKNYFNSLPK